jgi:thiol-disulfide isomerase/thioredoxin
MKRIKSRKKQKKGGGCGCNSNKGGDPGSPGVILPGEIEKSSNLTGGKKRKINRTVKKHKQPVIVGKFYSNGCGHCISMQKEWHVFEKYLKKKMPHVKIKNVEQSEIEEGKQDVNNLLHPHAKVQVNGFPTIFKFKNGKINYFDDFKSKRIKPDEYTKREFKFFKEWINEK